jgi:hypothetical protein
MTGPASPAKDLPAWLRAAYGKPLDTVCTRHVVDVAPDGTTVEDSYDSEYYTAQEWRSEHMRRLDAQGVPWISRAPHRLIYTDHRGHTITTTYADTEPTQ